MIIEYVGHDAGGVLRTGWYEGAESAVQVIGKFWPHAWIDLTVFNESGAVVGQIGKRKGRRCWWAAAMWSECDPNEVRP